jgi:hypothetical protein
MGMNGLARPSVEAGGLAGLAGAEEVVAGGGLAGLADGADEVVAAGALAEFGGGADEVVAPGGLGGVCATASETRRGSPTSAPAIQIRSIMQQDPTPQGRASCAARVCFTIPIKVTNLSPRLKCCGGARFLAHYAACAENAKAARGRPLRSADALVGFHSMPGESRLLRARR